MVNTLLFILHTLNCQALNNLCLCLSCSIFVLQSKLTEFSAILKQQQNDNTSRLVFRQREAWNEGNYKIIASCLYGKTRAISCKV